MGRISNWIRDKIKVWIFSNELERLDRLEKEINKSTHRLRCAANQLNESEKEIEECRKLLTQILDVGVDIGFRDDHSWAVVCIEGHPEYVKFMPLNHKDTRDIVNFLKQFQYSKQIIDSPFAFREMIRDRVIEV